MILKTWIAKYFEFERLKTDFSTEVLAGISTFFSLAYIFVVNPSILAEGGFDPSAVLFATVVVSAIATFLMGSWAKLPFVLAPGLEMSAYVSFYLIAVLGYSWQQGLTMVLLSGVLFLILTATGLRQRIIEDIPDQAKYHLAFGVGIFVWIIGWLVLDVVSYDNNVLTSVSLEVTPEIKATVIGLVILILLRLMNFSGAIVAGIFASAAYLNMSGSVEIVDSLQLTDNWKNGFFKFDWNVLTGGAIGAIFVLLIIDFYGSVAKFVGLTTNTPIEIQKNAGKALWVDGAATVAGAGLGTTSVTTFVESAVGIGIGGRTGLTAIVCALLMGATLFMAPFLKFIPVAATAPALLYVGYKLIPGKRILQDYNILEWLVMLGVTLIIVFFFSLDRAMLLTFAVYFLADFVKTKRINWLLLGSVILLAIAFALSLLQA